MGTTMKEQLARYHAVIFFESAAVGALNIKSDNSIRIESVQVAVLWSVHTDKIATPTNTLQHPRMHASHTRVRAAKYYS